MARKWIALFSQTGSEIRELSQRLGRSPDLIYTNNRNNDVWVHNMKDLDSQVLVEKHHHIMPKIMNYQKDSLITLHGYLRIIPPEVCHELDIINGHPGLIDEYPWLKGKDPQEKIEPWMSVIGSVCHRVTKELDGGEILTRAFRRNKDVETFKSNYYNILRQTSLEAWESYFEQYEA